MIDQQTDEAVKAVFAHYQRWLQSTQMASLSVLTIAATLTAAYFSGKAAEAASARLFVNFEPERD
jgi:hypothetical protein